MSVSRGAAGVGPVSELPSGTVTFVFTDIEGSSQRWDRDRAAMQTAVRRHDALMRAAIASHGGRVFKTIGDAFCAAFARPEGAIAAVLEVQLALAAEDFSAVDGVRARAAIHSGTADERDDDYFGPTVNRVARLLAIGHGAQVLVSGVTAELVRGALPAGVALRDLGEHRLKDIAHPERVHQLTAPGLRDIFPPLRSLDRLTNNLPRALTSFVGRETEIAEISAHLNKHRLVTLAGSGGVGKSRVAVEVASHLADAAPDGLWFIELAPLTNGDYIATTIAQTLALSPSNEPDPLAALASALAAKRTLLIFDNCEHLVEAVGRVAATLLRVCPQVKILATSRQSLGIAGEATYRMPPLEAAAATALFTVRATAADARFVLADDTGPVVADICRRLDGIPFAIELAAARVKMLSPRQLRDRLDERFRVLTGGSRDALPHQQTLRALIDWSHDLLEGPERVVFRRLGIFVNGFRLAGAIAVAADSDIGDLDVFDLLASLVDKSLVLAEPYGDELRYRLLNSTRAYALEKLDAAGEPGAPERDAIAGRHLRYLRDYFTDVLARYDAHARGVEKRKVLETELEDVRSALDRALNGPGVVAGGELLAAIGPTWPSLGLDLEGIARTERYLAALATAEPLLQARLANALAHGLLNAGRKAQALEVATRAVEHARRSGDAITLAWSLRWYAVSTAYFAGFADAERALAEAETIANPSPTLRIGLLETRGMLSLRSGDPAAAAGVFEQLRRQHRALGNARGERAAATNVAESEHARGETRRAIAILREVLPSARADDDESFFALKMLANLTGYLLAVDDLADAEIAVRETIELCIAKGDRNSLPVVIEYAALVAGLRDDIERAAILEGYANAAMQRDGYERESAEATAHARLTALLRGTLEPGLRAQLTSHGAGLDADAAVALALTRGGQSDLLPP